MYGSVPMLLLLNESHRHTFDIMGFLVLTRLDYIFVFRRLRSDVDLTQSLFE